MHGELDPFFQLRNFEYLQSLIPHSKLVVLSGSGHLPAMLNTATFPAETPSDLPPILIVHGLYGSARNWGAIARASEVIVIYMGLKHAATIAGALLAAGRSASEPVAIA